MTVAAALVPVGSLHDPFCELAAWGPCLACMIAYAMERLPEQEHTMDSVTRLFREMGTGRFDNLMKELVKIDPECLAAVQYQMFSLIQRADRTYASIQVLCSLADEQRDLRLKVPVQLILDDFAVAADACIPDFDRITSVIRSREISVSVILQSLSQLEASYGHHGAMTIINNCDHLLYLGG